MGIGTEQTLEFLQRHISSADCRLLEVGCGKGELAALLARKCKVRAIDKSQEAIASAFDLGVDASVADLLTYQDDAFDIVFFSRSLHHIHPLEKAIERAATLLKADGRLIIEEFAAELADRATVAWYFETRAELEKAGLFRSRVCRHDFDPARDPLDWWNEHHFVSHHLSKSNEMKNAIEEKFEIIQEEFVPYLYRYLIAESAADVDTSQVDQGIFDQERQLIVEAKIKTIGYRIVAKIRGDKSASA